MSPGLPDSLPDLGALLHKGDKLITFEKGYLWLNSSMADDELPRQVFAGHASGETEEEVHARMGRLEQTWEVGTRGFYQAVATAAQQAPDAQPAFVDVEEAARGLGISTRTLRRRLEALKRAASTQDSSAARLLPAQKGRGGKRIHWLLPGGQDDLAGWWCAVQEWMQARSSAPAKKRRRVKARRGSTGKGSRTEQSLAAYARALTTPVPEAN